MAKLDRLWTYGLCECKHGLAEDAKDNVCRSCGHVHPAACPKCQVVTYRPLIYIQEERKNKGAHWGIRSMGVTDIAVPYRHELEKWIGRWICFRCANPDMLITERRSGWTKCHMCEEEGRPTTWISHYNKWVLWCFSCVTKMRWHRRCQECDERLKIHEMGPYCRRCSHLEELHPESTYLQGPLVGMGGTKRRKKSAAGADRQPIWSRRPPRPEKLIQYREQIERLITVTQRRYGWHRNRVQRLHSTIRSKLKSAEWFRNRSDFGNALVHENEAEKLHGEVVKSEIIMEYNSTIRIEAGWALKRVSEVQSDRVQLTVVNVPPRPKGKPKKTLYLPVTMGCQICGDFYKSGQMKLIKFPPLKGNQLACRKCQKRAGYFWREEEKERVDGRAYLETLHREQKEYEEDLQHGLKRLGLEVNERRRRIRSVLEEMKSEYRNPELSCAILKMRRWFRCGCHEKCKSKHHFWGRPDEVPYEAFLISLSYGPRKEHTELRHGIAVKVMELPPDEFNARALWEALEPEERREWRRLGFGKSIVFDSSGFHNNGGRMRLTMSAFAEKIGKTLPSSLNDVLEF